MKIVAFTEPTKVNPYIDDVQTLADAGEGKAAVFEVEAKHLNRDKNFIKEAAHKIDKTARLRVTDDSQVKITPAKGGEKEKREGVYLLTYTLTTKHKARAPRGKAKGAESTQDGAESAS